MFRKLDISFRLEILFTNNLNISAISISFNNLMKIVPKGAIQSPMNCFPIKTTDQYAEHHSYYNLPMKGKFFTLYDDFLFIISNNTSAWVCTSSFPA